MVNHPNRKLSSEAKASRMDAALMDLAVEFQREGRPDACKAVTDARIELGEASLARLYDALKA